MQQELSYLLHHLHNHQELCQVLQVIFLIHNLILYFIQDFRINMYFLLKLYIYLFHYLYLYILQYKVNNQGRNGIHSILFHKHNRGLLYFFQYQSYKLNSYQLCLYMSNNLGHIFHKLHYYRNTQLYKHIKEQDLYLRPWKHMWYNFKGHFHKQNIQQHIFYNLYQNHHHKNLIYINSQMQNHLY